jgi:phosphopantothenate-cysteine ligase
VGFKLTSGLAEKETIQAGHSLLIKNDCDFVLANDTADLSPKGHKGLLVKRDGSFEVYHGKAEIAENIARVTLERLKDR